MNIADNIIIFDNQRWLAGTPELPLVTFALFTYNQEKYIREAVIGALSQNYPNLEIIISDDCSSDSTFEIAKSILEQNQRSHYHYVLLRRNKKNLGIGSHVNEVMNIARGNVVVAAAGDDISMPDRVSEIARLFKDDPSVMSVWSSANYIDDSNNILSRNFPGFNGFYNINQMVWDKLPVIGATHAWRRSIFDFFRPLNDNIMFEDNAISFRSFLLGKISFIDKKLVHYRIHNSNITNFVLNKNYTDLYQKAAIRTKWALNGIDQRILDLEHAFSNAKISAKDYQKIMRGLVKKRLIFARKLEIYANFPRLNLFLIINSFRNVDAFKVLLRTLTSKFNLIL